jgi:hypothetical protein
MNTKVFFLFFCMIFVVKFTIAQKFSYLFAETTTFEAIKYTPFKALQLNTTKGLSYQSNKNFSLNFSAQNQDKKLVEAPFSVISPSYYTQQFGFFCKKELQFEKKTKIPLKFRLGSVQQCDWLEGKPNSAAPHQ